MPPLVIDLNKTDDPMDAIHRAVEFLAAGKVVALPTETVYGLAANALSEEGTRRIREIKSRGADQPFSLAVKSGEDALDYVPNLSPLGLRLARRCWPGPITLVLDGSHPDSLVTQLPKAVQPMVVKNGTIGLRVPAHKVFDQVCKFSVGPMILTSANFAGEPDCTSGTSVVDSLGDQVDLVLDDGPARYGQASTVLRIDGNRYEILREGVYGESALKRMSSFMALVVCTGNTCRSPMAEVLLKKRLAERVGCSVGDLEEKGIVVASAGVAAMPGAQASPESVETMERAGLDLSDHQSQPVSDQLLESSDLILTMTNGHRQALVAHWPEIADRTHVIGIDGSDVSDPIGGPLELYERCARQIDENLEKWVEKTELGLPE
ncbi:MAG: L-threonylcarbamoyladenylate synthase [Planctomycetota bacterium]|nr:L-threonylcarbamoyladenylate synthase [Planctomycetota bacterium]